MKTVKLFILLGLCLFSAISCKENASSPSGSITDFVVAPKILSLVNQQAGYVWISPKSQSNYNWIITKYPEWVRPEYEAGSSDGGPVKLYFVGTISLDKAKTLEGNLEITIVGSGSVVVPVVLAINDNPKMSVTPSSMQFNSYSQTNSLQINNTGGGLLEWKIISENPIFKFSQDSGQTKNSGTSMINVSFDIKKLKPGSYTEYFNVYAKNDTAEVRCEIAVSAIRDLRLPSNIQIPNVTTDTSFYISNYGNEDVAWDINNIPTYVNLSSKSGVIRAGDSTKITISVLRNKLETGSFKSQLSLTTLAGTKTIDLTVINFIEEKTFFDYDVVDAKLLSASDLIVFATKNLPALRLVDFTGTVKNSIFLTYSPLCLSNIYNNKIAVGHSGSISIVNLTTLSVEKNIPISCDPVSLVLSPNNWVYASPYQDQWATIHCVDLSTNKESQSTGGSIYAGAKFIMHTSGKYIYSISMGLYPQDMEKYDISKGAANRLYDSRYHGDYYSMGWDFWMGDDGVRIFTSSGNVFKADELKENDMIYGGNIGYRNIHSLNESSANNIIALVYNSGVGSYLQLISDKTYSSVKSLRVPPYYLYTHDNYSDKYTITESLCRYVFVSSDGKKAFLVLNPYTSDYYSQIPKTGWAFYIASLSKK